MNSSFDASFYSEYDIKVCTVDRVHTFPKAT